MNKQLSHGCALLGAGVLFVASLAPAFALDARALFKATRHSVVFIGIFDAKDKLIGIGSGFFVAGSCAFLFPLHSCLPPFIEITYNLYL